MLVGGAAGDGLKIAVRGETIAGRRFLALAGYEHAEARRGASGAAWASRVEQGRSREALTLPRGAISPQQIGLIERFLGRRHELSKERRAQLAWQIAEPLLPLLGEDRDGVARRVDRGERCEWLLMQIIELAQNKAPAISVAEKTPPAALF